MCQDMFVLNNCIRSGYNPRKEETYAVKELLIKYLYQHGYAIEVLKHIQTNECSTCDGAGCWRCNDTGIYSSWTLYAFTFLVGNRKYKFHSPEDRINYPVELTKELPEEFVAGHIRDFRPIDLEISYMLNNIRYGLELRNRVYLFIERIKHVKFTI